MYEEHTNRLEKDSTTAAMAYESESFKSGQLNRFAHSVSYATKRGTESSDL
jgi:hypothetical protein